MLTNTASVIDENFQNADAVKKLGAEDCSDDEMASEKQRLDIIEAARQRQLNAARMSPLAPTGGQMQKKPRDSMVLHKVRMTNQPPTGNAASANTAKPLYKGWLLMHPIAEHRSM